MYHQNNFVLKKMCGIDSEWFSLLRGKKCSFCGISYVSKYSIPRFGTEWNSECFFKVIRVFFFVLEWFGMSFQKYFIYLMVHNEILSLLRNGSERNSELFHLLRNGSEWNSEHFPFLETDGIMTEWIKISVCSVFRRKNFLKKWQPMMSGVASCTFI